MKHLGDITKIKGCVAPVVDCIIGGSPCQDLSVAGKRAGLAGERSGLYMEQIRIIKEMRYKDEKSGRTGESIRPRYMVWENVPGAFSSNQGKDFAAVLEEAIKVADPEAASVPVPEKGWPTSGCIMGDTWSVAWRVLDAQFWGVPQRRRRIALVADFGGQSASEILFIRKGVSRDIDESESARKTTAGDAESGIGADDRVGFSYGVTTKGNGDAFISRERHTALSIGGGQAGQGYPCVLETVTAVDQGGGKSGANFYHNLSTTLTCTHGGEPAVAYTLEPGIAAREGGHIYEGVSGTLRAKAGDNQMAVAYGIQGSMIGRVDKNCPQGNGVNEDVSFTLNTTDRHAVCYNIGSYHSNAWKSDNPNSGVYEADKSKTLDALQCGYTGCNQVGTAVVEPVVESMGHDMRSSKFSKDGKMDTLTGCDYKEPGIVAYPAPITYQNVTGPLMANSHPGSYTGQDAYSDMLVAGKVRYIVRRLTPLECERLQGYPDGWTDIGEWVDSNGKKHKEADSPRYKALGNSIAIPPWKWVLKRLCACYERDATMASLFDGIGGFPYIWEKLNGKGSCLWASEIEEFPMAVTKIRFGGED